MGKGALGSRKGPSRRKRPRRIVQEMRSRGWRGTETPEIGENSAKNVTVAATLLILDGVERGVPISILRSRGRRSSWTPTSQGHLQSEGLCTPAGIGGRLGLETPEPLH